MFRKTLIARCLTLLVLALLSTNLAWGADVTYKFTPNAATTGSSATAYVTSAYSFTYNEIGWSFNQWNPSTLQIKTNQSSAGSEFNFKNTSAFPGKIKSVVITFKALTVSDASKLCFIGGSSAISSLSGGSAGTWNSTAKTLTWTPDATDNFTYFAFYQNGKAASGTNYLAEEDAIVITYEAGDTPAAELVSIAISGSPDKTTYEAGEEFDPAGLVVTGTYDTGDSEEITSGIDWTITPNPLTAGTTSVSVTAKVGEVESLAYQVNGLTVNARTLYSFGFETATSLDWDFENMESMQTHSNVTAHSGSYFGTTGGKSTASMTTKSAVAKPGILTCYVSKQSNNTTSSNWKIQVSSDNKSTWTDVVTSSATDMNQGIWKKITADLSSYENVYVRIYYTGSTATRNIDDVSLTLAKDVQSISVMTAPTKTTYNVGENFDPAGLVITATYDDESTEDIAYAGNQDKFTFNPDLNTALTTANDKVTITYGGKSCDQAIIVNLNKLATPTNLQATNVTSTSAALTWDEVENASSYEVNIDNKTLTAGTNSLLVEGLTASTAYTWTVKAKGDNTTYDDSAESTTNEFTTLAPPTVKYTVTFNGNEHGTPASESITEASVGAGVTLPNCTPNAGYQFVGWATSETATEAEYKAGAIYYPTEDITLYAVYNQVYTITWRVNGTPTTDGNPTTSVVAGEGITILPTTPADISEMKFQGWTATQIETPSTTAPTDLFTDAEQAPAITANTTFYAVFAEKSEGDVTWVKKSVSEISEGGVYAIITTDGHAFNGNISSGHGQVTTTAFSFTNNVAASAPSGTCEITFEAVTGGFKMYNADNGYLYASAASSGKLAWHNTEDSYWYYNSSDNGNWMYKSNSARLRSYNNSSFRTYGANNGDVLVFAKKTQSITYTYYTTVVVKVLTGISLSGEYPTEFWKGETFSHEGMTVTAHYSNAPDADVTDKAEFTGYDMATAGEQTVTVSYEPASTTYDITVKTITNTPETAYTVAKAKSLIDANPAELATTEVYVKGTVSAITESFNATYGNISFDVSKDGATTGQQFRFYRNFKGADKTKWTSAEECPAVGDDVIGVGTMKKYTNSGNVVYEFDEGNYLVSHIKASTLSIENVTVEIGGTITTKITTNVPEEGRTITYSVPSEDESVVKVDEEGNLVTVAVGGPVTVTVTLTAEGYKDATTTFTVEVIKALQSIAVKTAPTTISYKEGDKFNPAGLVIALTYSEGEPEDIAYEGNEDKFTFEPSLETELTTEDNSVTITYAGKTTTQGISVRELYTYNITWKANGEQFTTTEVTEGDALILPETSPDNIGDFVFKGWTATESYFNETTAPEYITNEIIPTGNTTYYAVYAKAEEESRIKEYSFAILPSDFSTTSYNANNGSHNFTATCTTDDTKQMTIACTTNQIMQSSNVMQWQKNAGYIYNTTDLGTIKSVEVNSTEGTFTTYYGTSEHPTSGTTVGNGFFTVKVGSATGKTSSVVVTFEKEVQVTTYSNYCTITPKVISENIIWDSDVTINGYTVTIENNAVLTVNGALINTDPENLIIKDGGQLIVNNTGGSKDNNINSGVKATVEKVMDKHGDWGKDGDNPKAGWYFLAAPMEDFAVASFIEQAGDDGYDLYRWRIINGTPIWYNYKAHDSNHDSGFETNFVSGRGYLAAYEKTDLLRMQGTLNAGTEFNFSDELNGEGNFTLLGNPFTYDLNWSDFNKTGVYDEGFAVVDSEDGIIEYVAGTTPIKVGTGFMVYTEDDGAELSFTKGSESGKSNDILALNLFASNGNGEDNTIIVLDDKNGGFAKADNFNTNVPQIYTERLQTKYGIRNFNTNTKEFNVSFKAAGEGSNTIRLETIGEFDYVHLYDKLLDVDVDMLLEGSYTFEASEDDDTHRFIVRIDKGNTGIDENETENFVNVYNGEIHVSGIGEVQIFDVMGRMVHSEALSGDATISTSSIKDGIYVVRLVGDGWTKAEKIVVRR